MKKYTVFNRLTLLLLLICVLLAGILSMQLQNTAPTREISPEPEKTGFDLPSINSFTATGIAAFREITERPLFIESRRPLPKPKPEQKQVVRLTPLRLALEGIVLSSAEKIAVFLDTNTNQSLHLTTGMTHQGWELTEITDNTAIFKRGEQTQELVLQKEIQPST